jgi:hypothetical protein
MRVLLKYGLVADVVTEETDRPVYVPPPVDRGAHAETCGCAACVVARRAMAGK